MNDQLPLPQECLDALAAPPKGSPYYFWSGNGILKTRVGNFQVAMRKVLELAGVRGTFQRFRRTLAKNLLNQSVSMEGVAAILEHRTSRVTSEIYASWVRERQAKLASELMRVWNPLGAEK
jgi:integrase